MYKDVCTSKVCAQNKKNNIYCHVARVLSIDKRKDDDDYIEWEGNVSQMTEMSKGSAEKNYISTFLHNSASKMIPNKLKLHKSSSKIKEN